MKPALLLIPLFVFGLSGCSKSTDSAQKRNEQLGEYGKKATSADPEVKLNAGAITQLYQQVGKSLNAPMLQCPERLWPNHNWKTMNVLFLQKEAPSLVWRGESAALENLPEGDIPEGLRHGLYSFTTWKNQDAVSIYLDDSMGSVFAKPNMLLGLIIHEGFHYVGQRSWESRGGERGTAYPVLSNPRIYRRLVKDRLLTYFLSAGTDQKALGQASYWFQKWSKEFPAEVKSTTDGYEGSARYMEWLGVSLSELGCQSSDEDLLKSMITKLQDPFETYLGTTELGLDSEGYTIGGLSALVLRLINRDTAWYGLIQKGQTPAEVLLSKVEPIQDVIDPTLQKQYDDAAASQNTGLEAMFGNDLRNLFSSEMVRVAIPSSAMKASYSPKGFCLPTEAPGVTVMPLAGDLIFQGDQWSLTALRDTNLFSMNSPCPDASFTLLVPQSVVESDGTSLSLTTPLLKGQVKGSQKKDDKGLSWFCGQ